MRAGGRTWGSVIFQAARDDDGGDDRRGAGSKRCHSKDGLGQHIDRSREAYPKHAPASGGAFAPGWAQRRQA